MGVIIGYLGCVFGAGVISGLTILLTMWSMPLWLAIFAWMAAAPVYAFFLTVYVGGFYAAWKDVFPAEAKFVESAATKDA